MEDKRYVVLSFSGGMDSSTLLLRLLYEGYNVTALSFDYGQKHYVELEKAKELVKYLNSKNLYIDHHIIILEGLATLLNSTLVEGGGEVPEGHYENANMIETVIPNRNKIFSSIIQAAALSIAMKQNSNCMISLGIHAGDHLIYLDCRQEFRDADFKAFQLGNWESRRVEVYTPFLHINKYDILKEGLEYCNSLNLDFDEIYRRTNTSYKLVTVGADIYSDYKSAASVERIEAFIKLGRPDPVQYADETGLVPWKVAKSHVEKILKNY